MSLLASTAHIDRQAIAALDDLTARRLLLRLMEREQEKKFRKLADYWPQKPFLDFYKAGLRYRKRAVLGGNQIGKTIGMLAEVAFHVTGLYPPWWKGLRFLRGNTWVVVGQTLLLNRDKLQEALCGFPKAELGAGLIPKDRIVEHSPSGIKDGFESVTIRHTSGTRSRILFRASEQGRANLQSLTVDGAAFDEEPPETIESEITTRTNISRGPILYAFTPLMGATAVVNKFYGETADPSNYLLNFSLEDCELYTEERKAEMIRDYPEHERQARVHGRPVLGSGLVFTMPWENISVEPFGIPTHWPRIVGMDFGIDHPTAATWCAWDRDADTWYLYDEYREVDAKALVHAAAIKPRCEWAPVAWPHDGLQRSKDTGIQLAETYRNHGLNMLPTFARHEETGVQNETVNSLISVEAGIMEMNERMSTGRWKVFQHLAKWKSEYLQYHRVNGQLVKINDDCLSASRYALMCKRFATTEPTAVMARARIDPNGWRV